MYKLILIIAFTCCLCSCSRAGLYSGGQTNFGSVVEFSKWPPLPKGVAGYNLYMSEKADGRFEKINDVPVSGGKIVVPKLEKGKEYFFKMTAVTAAGLEGKPTGIFSRKAGELSKGVIKPVN